MDALPDKKEGLTVILPFDWNLVCIFLLFASGFLFLLPVRRAPEDVLCDLSAMEHQEEAELPGRRIDENPATSGRTKELIEAGFFTKKEQLTFRRRQSAIIAGGMGSFLAIRAASGSNSLSGLIAAIAVSGALSYIASRYYLSQCRARFKKQLEFFLPVVMERIVMAVEAGFDIIPAIGAVLALDERMSEIDSRRVKDPVILLLERVYRLSQAGVPFDKALDEYSSTSPCRALRHAFMHLGLAQQEGGEVMGPLRELSDSTQLYYQEAIELEIAAMPVKATMPLVLTFAGLVILFLSTPLVQISNITKSASSALPGGIHARP